jgi:hypothetical protein
MLHSQCRLKRLPPVRRETHRAEKPRLETTKRMLDGEQVVAKLCRIDFSTVCVRQKHEKV